MKKTYPNFVKQTKKTKLIYFVCALLLSLNFVKAQTPTREFTKQVTTNALIFNGSKLPSGTVFKGWEPPANSTKYNYWFGDKIAGRGDCITAIDGFIFFAWYAGGQDDRYIKVSRYNPNTDQIKTFQLNWQHTGYRGNKNIGESHNSIAVGISPKDKTLHLLYDMHAYSADTNSNPGFYVNRKGNGTPIANRYFRYSYSIKDVTTIPDNNWTQGNVLEKAINNNAIGNYTHNSLNGTNNPSQYEKLTYPRFFLNANNDLFFQARVGGNTNGALRFYKYNATNKSWGNFVKFNILNAKNSGEPNAPDYNWGLYGNIKFLNGDITIGFQRRKGKSDIYKYQDGMFFARASNANGTQWERVDGTPIASPVVNADSIRIGNPERQLPSRGAGSNDINMRGPFDYTITERGDIHMIARVTDDFNNETETIHYFKPINQGWKRQILNSTFDASKIYTAGNKIYIIGLNSADRLRIDVSEGGTNSFTKIYEEPSGNVKYRNVTTKVIDGKVYVIGVENINRTDSKEPLHISVINLNLEEDITGKWFNLKNVATNRYLDSNGSSVVAGSANTGFDKQWKFVKSGDFYNIENRATGTGRGILRGISSSNQVVGTSFSAPRADIDKLWEVTKLSSGAHTIKIRTASKFMQNNTSNAINLTSSGSSNRAKWMFEQVGLSAKNGSVKEGKSVELDNETAIHVFPNPTNNKFTISLKGIDSANVIITDVLGKQIYNRTTTSNSLEFYKTSGFKSGLYLIKIVADGEVYQNKLVIK